MAKTEKEYVELIKKEIEEKLFLGSGPLRVRDLEYLAEVIEQKSGIPLSLSTLKRLWKEDFSQTPHPSTLKALAAVLEYKTWQEFKQEKVNFQKRRSIKPGHLVYALPIIVISVFIINRTASNNKALQESKNPIIKGDVHFSADKTISIGVPNTVVFNYDLSNVHADSFFIQQSWNKNHKERINPSGQVLSSIYYTPGFHRARLVANDSIIATQNVHILSKGWMSYVKYNMTDKMPIYLENDDIDTGGKLMVSMMDLKEAKVNVKREFMLRYCNIQSFDPLVDSNFYIKTRIKSDSSGIWICPFMELMLVFETNIFWVQLTKKGCEGKISHKIGERFISAKNNDLSAFGCDIYQWQELGLKVENKFAEVFLNENLIGDLSYEMDFGRLVGIIYTFTGTGSVDFIQLSEPAGNLVYGDQFD